MKISQVFYPNKAKRSLKTGLIPMYMRITINGKKSEIRLSEDISDKELLFWNGINWFNLKDFNVNNTLSVLNKAFRDFRSQNSTSRYRYSPQYVIKILTGQMEKTEISLISYVEKYYLSAVSNNSNFATGTVKNYQKAINHLKSFLKYSRKEGVLLSEINNSLALDFKDYLKANITKIEKKGMTDASAAGIIKKFRTILDRAVNEDLIKKNPFKVLKLDNTCPIRERLTPYQVQQLIFLNLTKFPTQEVYRDIFLFSLYTGLAYKDANGLNKNHLEIKPDGNIKLTLRRVKTEEPTELFLVNKAIEIVEKYKENREARIAGTILPPKSLKSINLQLKFIAELASMPIKLTSHIARHTYRQLLAEAGIEDFGVIKRMMGQSRKADIDSVYYQITETRLIEAKCKFEKFINDLLHN